MDANSTTVFTMALQPGSFPDCIAGDPGFTRPATVTVTPAPGVSRLPLSSTARLLSVNEPAALGNQV